MRLRMTCQTKGAGKNPAPKQSAPKQPSQRSPAMPADTIMIRTFDPLDYMTGQELLDVDAQILYVLGVVAEEVVLFLTSVDRANALQYRAVDLANPPPNIYGSRESNT